MSRGNIEVMLHWCVGCLAIWEEFFHKLTGEHLKLLNITPDLETTELEVLLFRRTFRARSYAGIIEHTQRECLGTIMLRISLGNFSKFPRLCIS